MTDKATLRKQMYALRTALAPEEQLRLGEKAAALILASPCWRGASRVGLYMPIRGEMPTEPLLQAALQTGKSVLLPYMQPHAPGCMDFFAYNDPASLKRNSFGIAEPAPAASSAKEPAVPDLLIVPGVAFDTHGVRLGYGKGYYDRYLARCAMAGAWRIGLAYSFQIIEDIESNAWDMPMHALCTENTFFWMEKHAL